MLYHLQERGLIWPAAWAAAGLAVLIGLGTWQMERRAWKLDLIDKIAARTVAEPLPLAAALEGSEQSGDVEYLRLRVRGSFDHGREAYLYMPGRDGPGYHVYTPLLTSDGRLVLVNRGFVPDPLKSPDRRPLGQTSGEVEIVGLARRPNERGWFIPDSDLVRRIYFWPDYAGMMAEALKGAEGRPRPVPFFLDAEASPGTRNGWPKGGVTRLDLPNRHLEYAVTWYGLAVALCAVFAVFAWGRLKSPAG
jgi:surfeit locus 1 family protein